MSDTVQASADLLIVDDTPVNLDILKLVLTRARYQVRTATNGLEALRQVEMAKPDLILLDIVMPELNGIATCKALKEDPNTRDIPIIFITSLDEVEQKVQGFQAGAIDYITKPFQKEEVLARIHNHLQLIRQQQQLSQQNLLLSNFAHIAAKDLKSPLIRMAGFTKILLKDWTVLSTNPQMYVQEIEESRFKMLASIENLLLLEDIRKPHIKFQHLAMRELIQEARLQLNYLIDKYQARIQITSPSFPTAIGHPSWVTKIWDVFLRHALTQSSGLSPQIEIGVHSADKVAQFWLHDQGPTLSNSYWHSLTSVDLTTQLDGLEPQVLEFAVIKALIQRMGGTLGLEPPSKGTGNVLFFTLPIETARR